MHKTGKAVFTYSVNRFICFSIHLFFEEPSPKGILAGVVKKRQARKIGPVCVKRYR